MCAALLVVLYDARKRAPASEGDALGMMSLGCVMQNMWLVAQSFGIGYQIQSVFGSDHVEREARRLLTFPDHFKIAFAVRLGYPKAIEPYLRVRREIEDFTHRNGFGPKRARGPGRSGWRSRVRFSPYPGVRQRMRTRPARRRPRQAAEARSSPVPRAPRASRAGQHGLWGRNVHPECNGLDGPASKELRPPRRSFLWRGT